MSTIAETDTAPTSTVTKKMSRNLFMFVINKWPPRNSHSTAVVGLRMHPAAATDSAIAKSRVRHLAALDEPLVDHGHSASANPTAAVSAAFTIGLISTVPRVI